MLKRLNIFESKDYTEELFKQLYNYMKHGEDLDKETREVLKSKINNILRYDTIGGLRPQKDIEALSKVFKKDYYFTGTIYHGLIGRESHLDKYKGLVSFSTNEDVAYRFADKNVHAPDGHKAIIIKQEACNAFYLASLISDLCDIDSEFCDICETYIGEDEVLTNLGKYEIIYERDCKIIE